MTRALAPCPDRPNCVCSRSDAPARNRITPFALSGDPRAAFARLKALLAETPRTTIAGEAEDYLHAVCRTRLGFADDLEFALHSAERVIHVRSASRIGYYDFGANRARIEALRCRFQGDAA